MDYEPMKKDVLKREIEHLTRLADSVQEEYTALWMRRKKGETLSQEEKAQLKLLEHLCNIYWKY